MKPITKVLFTLMFMFWIYYSCAELEKDAPMASEEDISEIKDIDDHLDGHTDNPKIDVPSDIPEDDPYLIAINLYNQSEYEEAILWFKEAANQNNVNACYYLGNMYYDGLGTAVDPQEAALWYKTSADLGHVDSQYALGKMYYFGKGEEFPQNFDKALEWFQKAADQGDVTSQYYLGQMYHYGEGTTQDFNKALELYQKAADQGNIASQYAIGEMYHYAEGVDQDNNKALELFQKAAEQKYGNAIQMIGIFHMFGLAGLAQGVIHAFPYFSDETPYDFKRRSEMGALSSFMAGRCYLNAMNCDAELNVEKGIEYLKISANDYDYEPAILDLAEIYEEGQYGIAQDIDTALIWYKKCADRNNNDNCQNKVDTLSP